MEMRIDLFTEVSLLQEKYLHLSDSSLRGLVALEPRSITLYQPFCGGEIDAFVDFLWFTIGLGAHRGMPSFLGRIPVRVANAS